MARILVICTANICRSPVAAALLRDRLRQRGLGDWTVSSAGTWAMEPRGASRYSVDVVQPGGRIATLDEQVERGRQQLRGTGVLAAGPAGLRAGDGNGDGHGLGIDAPVGPAAVVFFRNMPLMTGRSGT